MNSGPPAKRGQCRDTPIVRSQALPVLTTWRTPGQLAKTGGDRSSTSIMTCSYCKTEMSVQRIRVKRPVPAGAKDLGLSDDAVVWKCPRCEQTETSGIGKCSKCGAVGPYFGFKQTYASALQDDGIINQVALGKEFPDIVQWHCPTCLTCEECKQPIGGDAFRAWYETLGEGDSCYKFIHDRCYQRIKDECEDKLRAASHAVPLLWVITGALVGGIVGTIVGTILSFFIGGAAIPLFAACGTCLWVWIVVKGKREERIREVTATIHEVDRYRL